MVISIYLHITAIISTFFPIITHRKIIIQSFMLICGCNTIITKRSSAFSIQVFKLHGNAVVLPNLLIQFQVDTICIKTGVWHSFNIAVNILIAIVAATIFTGTDKYPQTVFSCTTSSNTVLLGIP